MQGYDAQPRTVRQWLDMWVICAIAIISLGYLCSNDSGNRAHAAGCITNAHSRSRVLCLPPTSTPPYDDRNDASPREAPTPNEEGSVYRYRVQGTG